MKITDSMIVGFMHGDGWLTDGYNHHKDRANPIQRCGICFSIHPDSKDSWCYDYFRLKTKNKIRVEKEVCNTKMVMGNHFSKKISVTDNNLWNELKNMGCPVGKKNGQKIKWTIEGKTINDLCGFLTGIYSAEGCVYIKNNKVPSIQLGMTWRNCVGLVAKALEKLGVKYTYFEHVPKMKNCGKVYKIYINDYDNIKKVTGLFDFRMDNRKQAKYAILKNIIRRSENNLKNRMKLVEYARKQKLIGKNQEWLRENVDNFNTRWLNVNYVPSLRWC